MKPLFSDEQRIQAVRNFLVACQQKKARIINYGDIRSDLNSERVEILRKLAKSGKDEILVSGLYHTGQYNTFYTTGDAQVYYEWLISVVSGTRQGIADEVIKKAIDQLFHFIQIMQNSNTIEIEKNVQLIAPYDWQKLFTSFDERLTDMQRIIDKSDKDTIEILKTLLQYMKENKTLLKTLCADSEELFGKGKHQ